MQASVTEAFIEYGVDGVTLLRYVYQPNMSAVNVPKPYFHPLRTLAGEVVTVYQPHDHPWHVGLMMTMSHLNDKNFWGGPSYTTGQGYIKKNNHGRIEHTRFDRMHIEGDEFSLEESIVWKPDENTVWLEETRNLDVIEINRAEGYWVLSFRSALRNVSTEVMSFGSPTTHGRPNAGYGGLFWRGPRSFNGGTLIAPEDCEEYMGVKMPWLAYCGKHDGGNNAQSTLLFVDDPSNPRYPNQWFVRTEPYGCVSFSFMFDQAYDLAPGDTLSLSYYIGIFDGARDRETLARVAERVTSPVQ